MSAPLAAHSAEVPHTAKIHPHPQKLQTTIRVQILNQTMPNTEHTHLHILRIVEAEPEISQRQLAERLGVSLGKANYLLKALLDKGHIKAGNFMRAENKLKYAYLLTPEGITAKLQLTRAYIARKEQEFIALQAELTTMRTELEQQAKDSQIQVALQEERSA